MLNKPTKAKLKELSDRVIELDQKHESAIIDEKTTERDITLALKAWEEAYDDLVTEAMSVSNRNLDPKVWTAVNRYLRRVGATPLPLRY